MKTIREISDELGVSKQAVFKRIKREPLSADLQGLMSIVDGKLMVSADGVRLIKQAFTPSTDRQPVDGVVDGMVDGVNFGTISAWNSGESRERGEYLQSEPSTSAEEKCGKASTDRQPVDGVVDGIISVLQDTIDTLQNQLEVKDKLIEQQGQTIVRLSDALVAAQALHAKTMQMQQQLPSGEARGDQQHPEPKKKRKWFSKLFGI